MNRKFSIKNYLVLAVFLVAAPFLNFYVQLFFSLLTMPALPGTRSYAGMISFLVVADMIGASIAAALLAAPLGWIIGQRPLLLASALSLAVAIVTVITWEGSYYDVAGLLTFTNLCFFFLASWIFARITVKAALSA